MALSPFPASMKHTLQKSVYCIYLLKSAHCKETADMITHHKNQNVTEETSIGDMFFSNIIPILNSSR